MNLRILRALFMEHAILSLPFLALGLLIVVLFVLPTWAWSDYDYQNELEPLLQYFALGIAMLGLLYSAADGERLTCELKERTLLLPVPTFVIVAVKYAYNTASIFLLSLFIHVLLRLTLDPPHEEWWVYPLLGMTTFVVLQALALAVGCLGDWSFGILIGAFFVTIGYLDDYAIDAQGDFIGITSGLFGAGLLVSWMVVHLRRTGRWDPELLLPRFALAAAKSSGQPLPLFKSAFDAQRWFEIRRMRMFLLMFLIGAGSTMGLFGVVPRFQIERFLEDYSYTDRLLWAIGQFGMNLPFMFVLAAFFAGGVLFFQNYRMQFGPLRAFFYLRPMSTTDLARARIAGSLRGLGWPFLFTVMLTLGSCSFWLLIDKENPSTILINRWSVTQLAGILILVFLGIAAGAWAAYWTGSIFFAVAMYMGLLLMVAPLHLLDAYGLVPMTYDELVLERLAYAIAALVMLAVLFRGVYRKHLSATRLGITLFISGAFSFALWFASYWDDIWSTREIQWGLRDFPEYVLFALFITLPLATIPLTLHWARHR